MTWFRRRGKSEPRTVGGYRSGSATPAEMKPPPESMTKPKDERVGWVGGGGYRGGLPASEVPPPSRVPSGSIRPKVTKPPVSVEELTEDLRVALVSAWHDTTCPEGADCRSLTLHMLSGIGLERADALAHHPAVRAVLDKAHRSW